MTLLDIALACEAASGTWYNHDLDADIYEALGYNVIRGDRGRVGWRYRGHGPFGYVSHWSSNRSFTYKLDHALTLVPEGWDVRMGTACGSPWAQVKKQFDCHNGDAPTLALALVAAALRARHTMEAGNEA